MNWLNLLETILGVMLGVLGYDLLRLLANFLRNHIQIKRVSATRSEQPKTWLA